MATGQIAPSDYADVVRIIGNGDTDDNARRAAAQGARHYLDDIAEAAHRDSRDDFTRPDIVAFATEIAKDEQATTHLADSFVEWVEDIARPFASQAPPVSVTGTPPPTLDDVRIVLLALETGIEIADQTRGASNFRGAVIGDLRENLASEIASEQGLPTPEPGQFNDYLNEHFEGSGNPITDIENARRNPDSQDDHWHGPPDD